MLQYAKAIYAAAVAALGSLGTVLVGNVEFGDVTQGQWVAVALSGLVAGGGVFGITNRTARGGGPSDLPYGPPTR